MSVIIKLLSKFDDSGIRKAKSGFSGLKGAIGAIGLGIGISQVTDLLLDSAKAASADEKSTKLLNTQLEKNTGATKKQIKGADKFIEKLSLQTGILDDDLRPSLGKLARATGDTKKAQDLLSLSLDAATVAGKPLDAVASAMAKAFNGNTGALTKMFPELKKSKDMFGDLKKEVEGAAVQQADPFMKFNNSMDILKEKLGMVILPLLSDFVDYISKPGGLIDQVGKFLDDMKDPKTEAGKMFTNIKDAAKNAFNGVKDFFALFGGGDAMKGFVNIAKGLAIALPALIALKGIMLLASAGKSLANLVAAISALRGVPGAGVPAVTTAAAGEGVLAGAAGETAATVAGASLAGTVALAGGAFAVGAAGLMIGAGLANANAIESAKAMGIDLAAAESAGYDPRIMQTKAGEDFLRKKFPWKGAKKGSSGLIAPSRNGAGFVANNVPLTGRAYGESQVVINVQSADPKAVVDAVSKYVKTNGAVPQSWQQARR